MSEYGFPFGGAQAASLQSSAACRRPQRLTQAGVMFARNRVLGWQPSRAGKLPALPNPKDRGKIL